MNPGLIIPGYRGGEEALSSPIIPNQHSGRLSPITVAGGYQSPVPYLLNYFYDVNDEPGINNPGLPGGGIITRPIISNPT